MANFNSKALLRKNGKGKPMFKLFMIHCACFRLYDIVFCFNTKFSCVEY